MNTVMILRVPERKEKKRKEKKRKEKKRKERRGKEKNIKKSTSASEEGLCSMEPVIVQIKFRHFVRFEVLTEIVVTNGLYLLRYNTV
jgi:hypothetical protein